MSGPPFFKLDVCSWAVVAFWGMQERRHLFLTSEVSLELVIFISLAAFAFGHNLV